MVEDLHADKFGLPGAFLSEFALAHGSDARMKVVEQFFECQDIVLGKEGTFELKPNEPNQFYLVGSTSLIHVEREWPQGTFHVIQPVQRKRGTIEKGVLKDKIVSQMKQGRKLWLLTPKAGLQSPGDVRLQESAQKVDGPTTAGESSVSALAIHPDEIVSETSSPRLSAGEEVGPGGEVDPQAFGQLRTTVQNVRLQFWNGNARSEPTESISVAAKKAENRDVSGAIQSIEMLENLFVRFIDHWEHDLHEAERRVKHGHGEAGDPAKLKTLKDHHLQMHSRIAQAKTQFRIMLNRLRDIESKQKRNEQGFLNP
jgi:hypothetical protein